jgi:hypothetical protein
MLAETADVGVVTIRNFESGENSPRRATLEVIERAFTGAGVEFIPGNGGGPGLRFKNNRRPPKST